MEQVRNCRQFLWGMVGICIVLIAMMLLFLGGGCATIGESIDKGYDAYVLIRANYPLFDQLYDQALDVIKKFETYRKETNLNTEEAFAKSMGIFYGMVVELRKFLKELNQIREA